MANIAKEQVMDWLSEQSVLEIASLVKNLAAKWVVSAAALGAAAAVSATTAADSPAAE
jgi:large subunit ribosomal protein L7/L12